MKKIKISLENLFKFLNVFDSEINEWVDNSLDIFIQTPNGDYTKLLGTVRKEDSIIKISTKFGRSLECGSKHFLIDEFGNKLYAKDSLGRRILCINEEIDEVVDIQPIEDIETVYDIGIEDPHLYVTPNGLIHHNTSFAKALVNDLNVDYMFLNGSEIGIDSFRNEIPQFAATKSIDGKHKVNIIDEFDRGNAVDKQKILRPLMEQFSKSCSFIITANDAENIINPIKSRCETIEFADLVDETEKQDVIKQIFKRIVFILKNENVQVTDAQIIRELVNKFFPDIRQLIGSLQKFGRSGVIDSSILSAVQNDSIEGVIEALKSKKFNELKVYAQKYALNYPDFLRELQETLYKEIQPASIPDLLTIIGDSNRQYNLVADLQIELTYMLAQLMLTLSFK